jgi:hypothetical protein
MATIALSISSPGLTGSAGWVNMAAGTGSKTLETLLVSNVALTDYLVIGYITSKGVSKRWMDYSGQYDWGNLS